MITSTLSTQKENMKAVFEDGTKGPPPVSIRLDLWHTDAVFNNTLPEEVAGKEFVEVEDHLGFARAARHRAGTKLKFRNHEIAVRKDGHFTITEYRLPKKTLTRLYRRDDDLVRQGIKGHTMEYPLKDESDYDAFIDALDDAYIEADIEGFEKLNVETGDRGLPMLILHSCPAHMVMLGLAGYESFYFSHADYPEKVEQVIHGLEKIYRRDLWGAAEKSSAYLLMHGNHFATMMTPPPIFEKYFVPYFRDFNRRMHAAGKKVVFHADAEMKQLFDLAIDAEFDGSDCLATAPLVDQTLEDCLEAWDGKIASWGGLPSTLFDPTFPEKEFYQTLDHIVSVVKDRGDFIYGVSDNVMPGAHWERLQYLAEVTGCRG